MIPLLFLSSFIIFFFFISSLVVKFRDKAPPSTKQMKVKVHVRFKSIIDFIAKISGLANFPRFT